MNVTPARLVVALVAALLASGCATSATGSPSPSASNAAPSATASPATGPGGIVIVGRIVTLDDPPVVEALLVRDGSVAALGTRDEVLATAGPGVRVVDIGDNVAYPGFIDAHGHWIGDGNMYGASDHAVAMEAAAQRGWTSISEQWVDREKLGWLLHLAEDDALPIRVDAYLALNFDKDFYGDWYADREPGAVGDHLRIRGLKIHDDDGWGNVMNWEPAELTATIGRANAAGWQVSIHAISSTAMEQALDAFESAIGPTGPNPLHHRIEHAVLVTDEQLARLTAMDLAVDVQLDGTGDWLTDPRFLTAFDRDDPVDAGRLVRWRDLVEAGVHLSAATDAPWTFPEFKLTDDLARPMDLIAAAMDGRIRTSPGTPPWRPDQLLTAGQGLGAVTFDAAWALGDEARRGHLAPGTLGDVTILSGDIATSTPDEIRALDVVASIVGGNVVYCSDATICGGPR